MSIQETINLIQRRIWTVEEDLLPRLNSVVKNIDRLINDQKKRIPIFPNDWTDAGVKKYVVDVEKAVSEPIKYMNKKKLEEIGVKTDEISEDVLGNTYEIGEILNLLKEIGGISDDINAKLFSDSLVTEWLIEGIDITREKLKEINDAKLAFKSLAESAVDKSLRSDLIEKALIDIGMLNRCDDIVSEFKYLSEFEITIEYKDDMDKFCHSMDEVRNRIQNIQDEFGVSSEQLKDIMKNKKLADLGEILNNEYNKYDKEKRKLTEEYNIYSYTLSSVNQDVSELPELLQELRETVQDMKKKCLEYLGESGLTLINYFKDGGEFPAQLGIDDIKKTLEVIRPLFIKILEREV